MELVPLHTNKEYLDDTVELLNSEWPRSRAARLYSLEKSCDNLPSSLILLSDGDVIGHSRLLLAQGVKNSCLLESVVVPKSKRGKGYGRILMEKTEKYATKMGFSSIFLNTIDKQEFYLHLGYQLSHPVVNLGANAHLMPESLISKIVGMSFTQVDDTAVDDHVKDSTKKSSNLSPDTPPSSTLQPPLPPPPPAPPSSPCASLDDRHVTRISKNSVTWMKKDLI